MLFCDKVGFLWLDLLWHLKGVCVETQWVFWVYLGFLGLSGFIWFVLVNFSLFVCMCV